MDGEKGFSNKEIVVMLQQLQKELSETREALKGDLSETRTELKVTQVVIKKYNNLYAKVAKLCEVVGEHDDILKATDSFGAGKKSISDTVRHWLPALIALAALALNYYRG